MNKNIRKDAILAMEFLIRSVNNEDFLTEWLALGVPDGDIEYYTRNEVDESLIENKNFSDLISLFLNIMSRANKDGSLHIDGVTGS